MTNPYVLGFVGENANGILCWWSDQILSGFRRYGLEYKLVDLTEQNWHEPLVNTIRQRKPELCFSFQGFGMDLKSNGENFWTQNNIPFVSYRGDSPYCSRKLYTPESPGLYLLYSCNTPYLQQALEDCPPFFRRYIDAMDLPDQLDATVATMLADPDMPAKVASGEQAAQLLSMNAFIDVGMEHIQLEANRGSVVGLAFPPARAPANAPTK